MPAFHISLNPRAITLMTTAALTVLSVCTGAASQRQNQQLTATLVIQLVDSQVQPRFQKDAGMFGEERVINELVTGHRQVDLEFMTDETPGEKDALKSVAKAPYFIIMGLMHVRHKPGSHLHTHDAGTLAKSFKPSSEPIEASGTTYDRAVRSFGWAEKNIGPATMWAYDKVRDGNAVDSTYGKFAVAIRPVKATRQSCISCHIGAHVGDTLGAMVYLVAPTSHHEKAGYVATQDAQHQSG